MICRLEHHGPRVDPAAYVHPGALVVGDVVVGPESSLWPGAVLRGDVESIRVGSRTNLQDHVVVHVTGGRHPTVVGDDVTVGHRAVLHGCEVEDFALVGIGAIVLDGARVGRETMIGAGALVTPRTILPPRSLVLGSPAKVVRELRPEEIEHLQESAASYVALARRYRASGL